MSELDRLCPLQVGVAGKDRLLLLTCPADKSPLKVGQLLDQLGGRSTAPEPQVESHLVVAAAPGVQTLAGLPDQLDQTPFDRHVNVFVASKHLELAAT